MMNEMAEPFGPPKGRTAPASASSASVVGYPSGSIAQPSGIGSFACAATMILPRATTLVAASKIRGASSPAGMPTATGFVPRNRSRPPNGAMFGGAFEIANPMHPRATAFST